MPITQPGVYRLTQDVANPAADRRKRHDWRADLVIPAGARILVEHFTNTLAKPASDVPIGYTLRLANSAYHHQGLLLRLDNTRWRAESDARRDLQGVLAEHLAAQLQLVEDESPDQYETICPAVRLDDAKLIVELAEQRLRINDQAGVPTGVARGAALRRIIDKFTR